MRRSKSQQKPYLGAPDGYSVVIVRSQIFFRYSIKEKCES